MSVTLFVKLKNNQTDYFVTSKFLVVDDGRTRCFYGYVLTRNVSALAEHFEVFYQTANTSISAQDHNQQSATANISSPRCYKARSKDEAAILS